jgi:hypothetical protein
MNLKEFILCAPSARLFRASLRYGALHQALSIPCALSKVPVVPYVNLYLIDGISIYKLNQ